MSTQALPENPHQPPARRWFQFRLRTLLIGVAVLAVPCAWAGYSLHWIRQRHEMAAEQYGSMRFWIDYDERAPSGLWLFGENRVSAIYLQSDDARAIEQAKRLFPEAEFREWTGSQVFIDSDDVPRGYYPGRGPAF